MRKGSFLPLPKPSRACLFRGVFPTRRSTMFSGDQRESIDDSHRAMCPVTLRARYLASTIEERIFSLRCYFYGSDGHNVTVLEEGLTLCPRALFSLGALRSLRASPRWRRSSAPVPVFPRTIT